MDLKLSTYAVYLILSICLTVWVARTLHKGGRRFLVDVFAGDTELADSVNHLLVVGFYLVNLGFVALFMRSGHVIDNPAYAMEVLAAKIGWVLLVLGGMHFFNLYIFARLRRRSGVNHEDNRERSSGGMLSPAAVTARLASERLSAEKLAEPAGA
jgi:hypothetical protein